METCQLCDGRMYPGDITFVDGCRPQPLIPSVFAPHPSFHPLCPTPPHLHTSHPRAPRYKCHEKPCGRCVGYEGKNCGNRAHRVVSRRPSHPPAASCTRRLPALQPCGPPHHCLARQVRTAERLQPMCEVHFRQRVSALGGQRVSVSEM
jgi:hypothetical protein